MKMIQEDADRLAELGIREMVNQLHGKDVEEYAILMALLMMEVITTGYEERMAA
jgi:hypothetical protein